jgi:hypothetical protein
VLVPLKYFVAVFGDPRRPEKEPVESGIYYPDPIRGTFPKSGDILLIYCTGNYPDHPKKIHGIGIVLGTDGQTVNYRYLPFVEPIPKSKIDQAFEPIDIAKFKNIRFDTFWLFKISKESFVGTVGAQRIRWP